MCTIDGFWILYKNVKSYPGDGRMEMNSVEFNRKVGQRIMAARLIHKYTREYLAELADISPKFLYEVETGKKGCSSYVLYRIAGALELKSDYIIYGDTEMLLSNDLREIMGLFNKNQVVALQDLIKMLYKFVQI